MAAEFGADAATRAFESPLVELPHGAKPFQREPVRGVGVDVLVEDLWPNTFGRHRHRQWQIVIVSPEGHCDVTWWSQSGQKRTGRISGGEVWILPPGWTHTGRWREHADMIALYVDIARVRIAFPQFPQKALVTRLTEYVAALSIIANLCRELRKFARMPNGPTDWRVAAMGSDLATAILQAHTMLTDGQFRPPSPLVGRLLEKLRAHVVERRNERVPLAKIARDLGVSDRHLRRLFRDARGESPEEWVMVQKATNAANLLAGGHSVKETVEKAAFTSGAHLHRVMIRVFGVSPAAYRRQAHAALAQSPDHR